MQHLEHKCSHGTGRVPWPSKTSQQVTTKNLLGAVQVGGGGMQGSMCNDVFICLGGGKKSRATKANYSLLDSHLNKEDINKWKDGSIRCYSHFDHSAKTINVERWHVQKGLIFKRVSLLLIILQSECVFEVKWLWSCVKIPYIWTLQTCKYIPIPFSKYEIYVQLMSEMLRIKRPDNQCEFVLILARMQTFL